jgi:predicted DNA-binding transcriptional regulator YafY
VRRTERLFQIIQILRRGTRPVTALAMAAELEVSTRTIYRDIAELTAQRVPIEGAAGVGYLLGHGYNLPPLMLTEDEIEALLIGARIVQSWADPALARAAKDALAKVAAVLPVGLRPRAMSLALAAPPSERRPEIMIDVTRLRRAVREQHKVQIAYRDLKDVPDRAYGLAKDVPTERTVWPMSLAFFPPVWLLLGWCELRADFRSFRLDRITALEHHDERYPQVPGRRLTDYLRAVGHPL